jgi:hypothetical protein
MTMTVMDWEHHSSNSQSRRNIKTKMGIESHLLQTYFSFISTGTHYYQWGNYCTAGGKIEINEMGRACGAYGGG